MTQPTNDGERIDNKLAKILLHDEDCTIPDPQGCSCGALLARVNIRNLIEAELTKARESKREIQLQAELHVLSILKAEADQIFHNVKQTIYTMHDKAWRDLAELQATLNQKEQE